MATRLSILQAIRRRLRSALDNVVEADELCRYNDVSLEGECPVPEYVDPDETDSFGVVSAVLASLLVCIRDEILSEEEKSLRLYPRAPGGYNEDNDLSNR